MPTFQETSAWADLKHNQKEWRDTNLETMFKQDPERRENLTFTLDGLRLDLSQNHLNQTTLDHFGALAKQMDVGGFRDRMISGEKINITENRAVLHTALRADKNQKLMLDGVSVSEEISNLHSRLKTFVESIHEGKWRGVTGHKITDVVSIGIGGSDLGPRLVTHALKPEKSAPKLHFVANVDAFDIASKLDNLNPATTLFIVVSKSFKTQETLLNAQTARAWLVKVFGAEAVRYHFVAVSTNAKALDKFGIPPENAFPMWDWVGGRTSLWSAAGIAIALSIGWPRFQELLDGAQAMDKHFVTEPFDQNIPVLLAMTGLWYRHLWNTSAHAILPYTERLRDLPRYLQQLDMESNGKYVTREGKIVTHATAPVIFGECGSIGQHSFHQWLHQGTDLTPTDFIGIEQDDVGYPEHHRVLNAHLKAQTEALMNGNVGEDLAHTNPGNRPSTQIWLKTLNAYNLGMLLALYEHKIFTQGVIWGINSYDQFGVELGKNLADKALKIS